MRQGPFGRRVARKSWIRWVAIGSLQIAPCGAQKGSRVALVRRTRYGQRRDGKSMEPAGGDTGTMKSRLAAGESLALPGQKFALSALAWRGDPSALPAMKVCLFSNPDLWTIGRHQKGPHRRCFKTSSDRRLAAEPTGLVISRVPSRLPRHFEGRGTPTGTCDFGQARYKKVDRHNQPKIAWRLQIDPCRTMLVKTSQSGER